MPGYRMTDPDRVAASYALAKASFAAYGIDTDAAIAAFHTIPISLHNWQGDDVRGFEGITLAGENVVTGSYPGRARTASELRQDIETAFSLSPCLHRVNLHSMYAEPVGKKERNEYTAEDFSAWISWAVAHDWGMDFNASFFTHPMMDNGMSLASRKKEVRDYWVRAGINAREISEAFYRATGKVCYNNIWVPDGMKDTPYNRALYRGFLTESLDRILEQPREGVRDVLEGKLFGIGVESFTVGSHEFYLAYAASHKVGVCMDTGHYHPTEQAYDKLSAVVPFLPYALLHISRGIRWDSDHVLIGADELEMLMREMKRGGYFAKVGMGLDYFDASINRVAAWVIGLRAFGRSLLAALLEPGELLEAYEAAEDYTSRLALTDELRNLPVSAVWDMLCLRAGVPVGADWLANVKAYERDVQAARG
ncbi:MAG: L-rhamnose isomerase [Eubacteriales bacterium]|jgi:L-rhamnose isomerase